MPEITEHQEGMLCWADLSTSDLQAAKRFYGELFGWSLEDIPMGDAGVYVMARRGGKDVCGLAGQMADQKAQGIPPNWMSYIAVKDVDARTAKVQPAGGRVLMGPFDVMDVGRMAVVQDPTGAVISLWQEKKQRKGVMNEPGSLCWTELMTGDPQKAKAFYTQVLPWKPKGSEYAGGEYTEWMVGDKAAGGMMQTPEEAAGVPAHWGVYFAVEDCDATVKKAQSMGAQVHVPPTNIPRVGRFAVLEDPQGAAFNVLKYDTNQQ